MNLIVTTSSSYCKHPRHLFNVLLMLCVSVVLSACALDYATKPAKPIVRKAPKRAPAEVQTYELEQGQTIDEQTKLDQPEDTDPWSLVELARELSPPDNHTLLLQAAELFLYKHYLATAHSVLSDIDPVSLNDQQQTAHLLMLANHALLSGDTAAATRRLSDVQDPSALAKANYIRWLKLDIAIANQHKDYLHAVFTRIKLDALLERDAQLHNQLLILSSLSRNRAFFSSLNLAAQQNEISPWWALIQLQLQQPFSERALSLWQLRNEGHPAQIQNLHKTLIAPPVSSRQIALLLPLTSRLGRAAAAFKAGFYAANQQSARYASIQVYDIGEESGLVPFYYQSAIDNNADIIIGPLGRSNIKSMLQHLASAPPVSPASTVLLGDISAEHAALLNIWGFSLSAGQGAEAIAERAIELGFQSALVLQKNNDWGTRAGTAFATAFSSRGGTILGRQTYQAGSNEHSIPVKNLLKINDSEIRHLRLQKYLGRKLKSSVRRRDDVDFVFLAGNAKDARGIIPLTNFYRAHDLPLFATSGVFSGKYNKLMDQDLAGLHFPDLPWLLEQTPAIIKTDTQTFDASQPRIAYASAMLNRLYALGFAAFEALPQLSQFPPDTMAKFDTQTMTLHIDNNRNLQHSVAWGKYTNNGIALLP